MSQDKSEENTLQVLESKSAVPSSPYPPSHTSQEGAANKSGLVEDSIIPVETGKLIEDPADRQLNPLGSDILTKIEWTPELDVALLYALQNHKLVGSNKYFHMICVHDAFTKNAGIQCTIDCIWDKMSQWYDLDLLADNEINPFPIPDPPNDFCLPEYFSLTQPLDAPIVVDSDEGSGSYRLRSTHKAK